MFSDHQELVRLQRDLSLCFERGNAEAIAGLACLALKEAGLRFKRYHAQKSRIRAWEEYLLAFQLLSLRCSEYPWAYEVQLEVLEDRTVKLAISPWYELSFQVVKALFLACLAARGGENGARFSALFHGKLPLMAELLGGRVAEINQLMAFPACLNENGKFSDRPLTRLRIPAFLK